MEGTPFGRYRLIELLGVGGMGVVWRAHDTAGVVTDVSSRFDLGVDSVEPAQVKVERAQRSEDEQPSAVTALAQGGELAADRGRIRL